MEDLIFVKPEIISMKQHSSYNEKWLQSKIQEDPSILGLGDVNFWRSEKIQPEGGRLDTILVDPDDNRRYEVEIQLGKTDESHIIRTIEYWDNESKRYPQYKHCAVIVAEEITSRFFNVIALFNKSIPLIAIQVKLVKIENTISLFFTKIMDEQKVSSDSDDMSQETTDEAYWLKKRPKQMIDLVKKFKETFAEYMNEYDLTFRRAFLGLAKNNVANNFIYFTPRKQNVVISFRVDKTEDIDEKLEGSNLSQLAYDNPFRSYKIKITEKDLTENREILELLVKNAYDNR